MAAPQLLNDIALRFIRSDALSIYEVQDQETRTTAGGRVVRVRDLSVSSNLDNLRQAITDVLGVDQARARGART